MKTLVLLFGLVIFCAYADTIYQYQDANGVMVYTNKPIKKAKKVVNLPALGVLPKPVVDKSTISKSVIPIYNTSNLNETSRREILNTELHHEQNTLKSIQDTLANAEKLNLANETKNQKDARINVLKDSIKEHQKNIDSLIQSLGQE